MKFDKLLAVSPISSVILHFHILKQYKSLHVFYKITLAYVCRKQMFWMLDNEAVEHLLE